MRRRGKNGQSISKVTRRYRTSKTKEGEVEKASRLYKANTGVVCDGIPPESSFGLEKRNMRINCRVLGDGGTKWQTAQQVCTTLFFLIPKANCAYADVDMLVGSLESARSGKVPSEVSS